MPDPWQGPDDGAHRPPGERGAAPGAHAGASASSEALSALVTGPLPVAPAWLNQPDVWAWDGEELSLTTRKATDFWRHTHYGVVRDTGHFLGTRVRGEFVAGIALQADLSHQYDQAGLMVRLDAERWVKAGLERGDGEDVVSVVATHGVSDWSISRLPAPISWLRLRITRRRDSLAVETRTDGGGWVLQRVAYMPAELPALVGPMAAAPDGPGFAVRFRDWTLRPI